MSNVLYFHAEDPILRLSDHSKISLRSIAKFKPKIHKEYPYSFTEKFKWESMSTLFNQALQSEEIKLKLEAFSDTPINETSDINSIVRNFKEILLHAANMSLKKTKVKKSKTCDKKNGLIQIYTKCGKNWIIKVNY